MLRLRALAKFWLACFGDETEFFFHILVFLLALRSQHGLGSRSQGLLLLITKIDRCFLTEESVLGLVSPEEPSFPGDSLG